MRMKVKGETTSNVAPKEQAIKRISQAKVPFPDAPLERARTGRQRGNFRL